MESFPVNTPVALVWWTWSMLTLGFSVLSDIFPGVRWLKLHLMEQLGVFHYGLKGIHKGNLFVRVSLLHCAGFSKNVWPSGASDSRMESYLLRKCSITAQSHFFLYYLCDSGTRGVSDSHQSSLRMARGSVLSLTGLNDSRGDGGLCRRSFYLTMAGGHGYTCLRLELLSGCKKKKPVTQQ